MIYEATSLDTPIRQGDIFIGLPRIDLELGKMLLAYEEGDSITRWEEISKSTEPTMIVVPVRSVAAIVATQDCDAIRSDDITLCEILPFRMVDQKCKDTKNPKGWKNIITQQARLNLKWFYLPPDPIIGFEDKMAVSFNVTLRLPREDLENLRYFRKGRLNDTADEHFRERISEFFRRYPYDEWYSLDKSELIEYKKDYPDIIPYPWQQQNANESDG